MAWAFFLLTYFGGGHNHCDDDAREYRWINSSVYSMSGAYPGSSACRTSIEYMTVDLYSWRVQAVSVSVK